MNEVLKGSRSKNLHKVKVIDKRRALFLALMSGVLLYLSFPKFGMGIICWVALVPLFFAIRYKTPSEALTIGFITGLIFNIGILYWVTFVIVMYGYLHIFIGILAMLLLAAYLSIYIAIFCAGLIYLKKSTIPLIINAPVLWTCLEYTKSNILTGFPWENLAYSQYMNHKMIQMSDLTGIYGISFLIVLINAVIYDLIYEKPCLKRIIFELLFVFILLFLVFSYGTYRIQHFTKILNNAKSIEINLIQGNIDQNIKWNSIYQEETINIYQSLSLKNRMSRSGLTVWPETAVPFYFQDIDDLHRKIIAISKVSKNWFIIGSPSYIKNDNGISYSNSAFLLSPNGQIVGQYDKVHLVPYGEYVPLRKYFPFVNKLVDGVGDFKSGKGYHPLIMDNNKLGVLICYEGIFPEPSRQYKNVGVDLLVNITNDAWYGRTSAPYQHLSMVIFRAIETRLYLVRAANTGISAIIDATGKILSQSGLFERTSLSGKVKVMKEQTFYSIYGDVFIYICIAFLIFNMFLSYLKEKKVHD